MAFGRKEGYCCCGARLRGLENGDALAKKTTVHAIKLLCYSSEIEYLAELVNGRSIDLGESVIILSEEMVGRRDNIGRSIALIRVASGRKGDN